MTLDPTKPVQTRDGRPARILATDLKGPRPIAAAIRGHHSDRDYVYEVGADGRMSVSVELPEDLVNAPEASKHVFSVYFNTEDPEAELMGFNRTRFGTQKGRASVEMTVKGGVPVSVELV